MKFELRFVISWLMTLAIFLSYANSSIAGDGILLQSTRIIYSSSKANGITFTVTNKTSNDYLLQSRVSPWPENEYFSGETDNFNSNVSERKLDGSERTVPFIVLPPLTRFDSGEAINLNIRLTEKTLPNDRETLFTLKIKTIPGQSLKEDDKQPSLALALQNNLKLFYRPQEIITLDAEIRSDKLIFQYMENHLLVENPTPYYITFSDISVNNNSISLNNRMLSPYSTAQYPMNDTPEVISWSILDDRGSSTEVKYRKLK